MKLIRAYILFFILLFAGITAFGQSKNSAVISVTEVPVKYLTQVSVKADKYSNRITSKTVKTLTKLSKWEQKTHSLLQKADPATAERLFGVGKPTFASMLAKVREGKAVTDGYKAQYDSYTDKLATGIKYLETKKDSLDKKFIKPIGDAKQKMQQLDKDVAASEAVERMIKERKKELIDASVKLLGKSKYLKKINKETYYYTETLRNYKEIFNDSKKTEETAKAILNRIPAFKKFFEQNSQLASLFGSVPANGSTSSVPVVNGLSSRASLQQYFQTNLPAVSDPGTKLQQQMNVPEFKSELAKLSSLKPEKTGLPDFKPNSQRAKPFGKRIEKGFDIQFGKSVNFLPATCNLAINAGYKINDNSSAGLGVSYILGLGHGWDKINLSSEGIGLRTYVKWKLAKNLDIQGGREWNYMHTFQNFRVFSKSSGWQQSALLGLNKLIPTGRKVKGNVQVLFDFLYNKHNPVTQPVVFRAGYNF